MGKYTGNSVRCALPKLMDDGDVCSSCAEACRFKSIAQYMHDFLLMPIDRPSYCCEKI